MCVHVCLCVCVCVCVCTCVFVYVCVLYVCVHVCEFYTVVAGLLPLQRIQDPRHAGCVGS